MRRLWTDQIVTFAGRYERVTAAGLGLPDVFMCRGTYPLTPPLPFTSGQEATVVEGVRSTVPFLRKVLHHPDVRRGVLHTQMVDQGAFR